MDNDSDVCYTYDNNGRLIYKSQNGIQTSYLWDSLDRLKAIYYYNEDEQEIHRVEYTYNGDGEKIFEIRDGVRTGYLYDAGRLIAEYNASGKVFAQYIHGSGLGGDVGSLLFAQKLIGSGEETSVETSYYFHNWRGDVVAVTGESGNPLDTYRYSAFGEVIEQSGASDNDILFSSKRYHDATALSYFGARYYDASLGRFISRDPLGYIDGPNGYIYVSNKPINLIDPFGLSKRDAWNYTKDSASQIVLGNYTDKVTIAGTIGQVGLGLTGFDVAADVRDLIYDVHHWEWSWSHAGQTFLDGIALLPVVGAIKYTDEAWDVAKPIIKNADEVADGLKNTKKLLTVKNLSQHHIFPQQYKKWFTGKGINIDEFTVTIPETTHLKGIHGKGLADMPGNWNKTWSDFIKNNPNATQKEIYQKAGSMLDEYGINKLPITGYEK